MKKSIQLAFLFALAIFSISIVSAANECPIKVNAKNTAALLEEIPSINSTLQTCPTEVPSQFKRLITNGIFLIDLKDGETISIFIKNGIITGVQRGGTAYTYKTSIDRCFFDVILSKENRVGAFAAYYLSGKANLGASGFFNKIKLGISKLFIRGPLAKIQVPVDQTCPTTGSGKSESGKPENCHETYMEGHREYQYAKAEWDRRKAETEGVCQTATAEMPKGGNCVYLYEQIQNNDKKWLCWYK